MGHGKQSFNQVQLEGVITAFNESTSKSGKKFAKATLRDINSADFALTIFGEAALDVAYRANEEGSHVLVSGRVDARTYQDKSGNERTALELVIFNVYEVEQPAPRARSSSRPASGADDDIPY